MTTPEPVTFADLARLYEQATSAPAGGLYTNIFRDGLIEAVGVYVQQDDPTVEVAYLKAKLADLKSGCEQTDGSAFSCCAHCPKACPVHNRHRIPCDECGGEH